MGTHFKTGWESKGTAVLLALGHPIGAGSVLLAGDSKGGRAALAGGIQRRAAPSWQEESNETRGFVAHDFARKVVCVIPLATADVGKGVFPYRTHLFQRQQNRRILRPTGRGIWDLLKAKSACSGVGGVVE